MERRIKIEFGGGSSRVLRKALADCSFKRSAATIIETLKAPCAGLRQITCINSRTCSTRMSLDLDSGRTQCTSGCWSPLMRWQFGQASQQSSEMPVELRFGG